MKGQPGRQPAKGGKMEVLLRTLRTFNVWRSQLFMHEACASKPPLLPDPLPRQDKAALLPRRLPPFHYV